MNNKSPENRPSTPEQAPWKPPEKFDVRPANEQSAGQYDVYDQRIPRSEVDDALVDIKTEEDMRLNDQEMTKLREHINQIHDNSESPEL